VNSEPAKKAIQFLKQHHTIIDPTVGWEEMRPHPKDVDVTSFEPGMAKAPTAVYAKFRAYGGDITAEQVRARTAQSLKTFLRFI
jgi:hypothetical protein